ncbi:L,D-transpeptidase [Luteolibacter algae]|uniref:L,D-transpeptidase n=1 Tax=Luteolibacter algae TaxID=454151 RepID=A0ABW5D8Y4_9BACT
MKYQTFLMAAVGLAAAMGFSSCSMNTAGGGMSAYQSYDRPAKLPKNPSAVKVKVSLSKQRVYVMEGNDMLLAMPVSVGTASTPTPTGNFRIFNKEHKHRANSHGYAYSGDQVKQTYLRSKPSGWSFKGTPMPYWCEFKPNYGFHTGWVKHTPCTHGCVRMHQNLAPKFYRLVSNGTPVNISYSQSEDAQYADMPLPPDAGPLPDYPGSFYIKDDAFDLHKKPSYE